MPPRFFGAMNCIEWKTYLAKVAEAGRHRRGVGGGGEEIAEAGRQRKRGDIRGEETAEAGRHQRRGGGGDSGGGEGDRDDEGGRDGRGDLMRSIFNGHVVPHYHRRDGVTHRRREGRQTIECGGRTDNDVFYLEALICYQKLLNCF